MSSSQFDYDDDDDEAGDEYGDVIEYRLPSKPAAAQTIPQPPSHDVRARQARVAAAAAAASAAGAPYAGGLRGFASAAAGAAMATPAMTPADYILRAAFQSQQQQASGAVAAASSGSRGGGGEPAMDAPRSSVKRQKATETSSSSSGAVTSLAALAEQLRSVPASASTAAAALGRVGEMIPVPSSSAAPPSTKQRQDSGDRRAQDAGSAAVSKPASSAGAQQAPVVVKGVPQAVPLTPQQQRHTIAAAPASAAKPPVATSDRSGMEEEMEEERPRSMVPLSQLFGPSQQASHAAQATPSRPGVRGPRPVGGQRQGTMRGLSSERGVGNSPAVSSGGSTRANLGAGVGGRGSRQQADYDHDKELEEFARGTAGAKRPIVNKGSAVAPTQSKRTGSDSVAKPAAASRAILNQPAAASSGVSRFLHPEPTGGISLSQSLFQPAPPSKRAALDHVFQVQSSGSEEQEATSKQAPALKPVSSWAAQVKPREVGSTEVPSAQSQGGVASGAADITGFESEATYGDEAEGGDASYNFLAAAAAAAGEPILGSTPQASKRQSAGFSSPPQSRALPKTGGLDVSSMFVQVRIARNSMNSLLTQVKHFQRALISSTTETHAGNATSSSQSTVASAASHRTISLASARFNPRVNRDSVVFLRSDGDSESKFNNNTGLYEMNGTISALELVHDSNSLVLKAAKGADDFLDEEQRKILQALYEQKRVVYLLVSERFTGNQLRAFAPFVISVEDDDLAMIRAIAVVEDND